MNHATRTLRSASLTGGIALLAMAIIAAVSNFGFLQPLITPGDAVRTAADISDSDMLFRLAIAGFVLIVLLDVIVAGALFTLFEPVNRSVSTMAAWSRVAYAAVYLVAIGQLMVALGVLGDADQALRAIEAFTTIWNAGLILFALHLLLIGYLAYRSGFMPRLFGVLLVVAGLGYLVDGFGAVLVAGYSPVVAQFTFVGEVALIFWLLIKGTRMTAVPLSPEDDRRPVTESSAVDARLPAGPSHGRTTL